MNCNSGNLQSEERLKETSTIAGIPSSVTAETPVACGDEKERSDPVVTSISSNMEEDTAKSAAAIVATELTASASSAEMLSFVHNSLASNDGTVNQQNPPPIEFSSLKRIKLENATPSGIQSQQPATDPLPSCPHPEPLQYDAAVTSEQQQKPPSPDPILSSSSLPLTLPPTPLPQSQFMQSSAASMTSAPNSYAVAGVPSNQLSKFCQEFPGSEGGFYNQSSVPASSTISQQ